MLRKSVYTWLTALLCTLLLLPAVPLRAADPGSIGNYTDVLCLDRNELGVWMTVQNLHEAAGAASYRYRLCGNGADGKADTIYIDKDSISLDYFFRPADYPQFVLPATFELHRQALIGTAWQTASGKGSFTVSRNEYTFDTVRVCKLDTYTGSYTNYADQTDRIFFSYGDTADYVNYDKTSLGCDKEYHLHCTWLDVPEVEIEPLGVLCQTDKEITVYFNTLRGTPTSVSVSFNKAALKAGFKNKELALKSANHFTLTVPTTSRGDYAMYVQFYDTTSLAACNGKRDTLAFNLNLGGYVVDKWDDVLLVDNNPSNANPDAVGDTLYFASYQWYKNGRAIGGATGQVYHEEFGLNGVYYVEMTDTLGRTYRSCAVEKRPVIAQSSSQEVFTVEAGQPGSMLHYTSPSAGTLAIYDLSGKCLTSLAVESGDGSIQAPPIPGLYMVRLLPAGGKPLTRKLIVR